MKYEIEYNMWKFYDNVMRVMEFVIIPTLMERGLNFSQLSILLTIEDKEILSVSELSELTRMNLGNCSSTCKNLEKLGWISRERSKNDERRVEVQLTEQGREMFEDVNWGISLKYKEILKDYSEEEVEALNLTLENVNEFLSDLCLKSKCKED